MGFNSGFLTLTEDSGVDILTSINLQLLIYKSEWLIFISKDKIRYVEVLCRLQIKYNVRSSDANVDALLIDRLRASHDRNPFSELYSPRENSLKQENALASESPLRKTFFFSSISHMVYEEQKDIFAKLRGIL